MREDFPIADYLRLLQERPDVSSNQIRQMIEFWAAQNEVSNFFTMVYMVLDTQEHTLAYSNAGHPRPVLLRRDGRVKLLKRGGPVIGLLGIRTADDDDGFMEEQLIFHPGDKLFLHTDGLNEYSDPEGQMFGNQRLHALLKDLAKEPVAAMVDAARVALRHFGRGAPPDDDITLLGIEFK